ncbi:MAG: hypothetical protein HQ402_00185 [Parcubacteria group bacterium]|nr:hypothetical protein [Parcubacteria group bacterium]
MKNENAQIIGIGIIVILAASGLFGKISLNKDSSQTETSSSSGLSSQIQVVPISSGGSGRSQSTKTSMTEQQRKLAEEQAAREASIYKDKITISSINSKGAVDGSVSFLTLYASGSNKEDITVTGWTILSTATGNAVKIGNGSYLPSLNTGGNVEKPIVMKPRERMYIYRWQSQIPVSFHTNICTGYFNNFATYRPTIEKDCPLLKEENTPAEFSNDENCWNYIKRFGKCATVPNVFPDNITKSCQNYIQNTLNYNYCVNTYFNDPDFYTPQWRVSLNIKAQVWKKTNETIKLLDQFGKTVDTASYTE